MHKPSVSRSSPPSEGDDCIPARLPPDRFTTYAQAGFTEYLLPILPSNAQVHPDSPSFDGLVANRGKVPAVKRRDGWMGFHNWRESRATPDQLALWSAWGAGVGMQGRRFPALDIDVDDEELADALHAEALAVLGEAPARFGRGSRRILVYAGEGHPKRRLAFRKRQETLDAASRCDVRQLEQPQAVEFLGTRQQYVLEGIHPKTGQPYVWRDGRSPASVGPAGLKPVDTAALDGFFDRVEKLLELFEYEVVSRSALHGGDGDVWQEGLMAPDMDVVARALAALPNEVDYDTWLKIGAAVKASAGPERQEEAFDLWLDWSLQWPENTPEMVEAKWRTLEPPFRVGWDYLARYCTEEGDGTFFAAAEDFDAIEEPPAPGEESKGPPVSPKVQALFDRWVWVERLKRACDIRSGELLDREQFNVRNAHIGPPTSKDGCAWAVLISNPKRLQAVKAVTYRPGGELFINERLPGLTGSCINRWKDPALHLPATATDAEIAPWMAHVEFVVPDPRERTILLDWLAWIVQNPGEKPNWALVLGSTVEGIGKDMMIEPVRAALGQDNVREIGPDDLASCNTDYLENVRLLLIEEMEMAERKSMMNKLKPVIAAPPYTLRVNIKFEKQFEIPNLIAAIFFTNMDNALHLSKQGRRYFVMWNEAEPKPDDYYRELASWFEAGGAALGARWLLSRDVSGFNAKGRAPDTAARENMRKAARSRLDEWIEDGLADGSGVFYHRLVTLQEVAHTLRGQLSDSKISDHKVAAALRRAGCVAAGRPMIGEAPLGCSEPLCSLGREPTVFARKGDPLIGEQPAVIREAYWAERRSPTTATDLIFGLERQV